MMSTVKCKNCRNINGNEDFLDISLPLPPACSQEYILSSNPPQNGDESNKVIACTF